MKAIMTKYISATNVKGSRVKAYTEGGNSLTISYPHELSGEDVYRKAAEALRDKMNWSGDLIGGGTDKGDYVFVFVPDEYRRVSKPRRTASHSSRTRKTATTLGGMR